MKKNVKPDYDISKLLNSECVKRCNEFIPKFKESTLQVESDIKQGKINTIDSNLQILNENFKLSDESDESDEEFENLEECEKSIFLNVGVGVFDVKGTTPSEETLKDAGISILDFKPKEEEMIISEVKTKKFTKSNK